MANALRPSVGVARPLALHHNGARLSNVVGRASIQARPGPSPSSGYTKDGLVEELLTAKEASGKSFTEIARECGLSNIYVASLFYNQQQLKPSTASALSKAVPTLTADLLSEMMRAPSRRFDPNLIQEPAVYRLYEAIMHNGEALKAVINEEFGDGIMSAIDFHVTMDRLPGKHGEARVVLTLNGKFLPFVEQRDEENVALRADLQSRGELSDSKEAVAPSVAALPAGSSNGGSSGGGGGVKQEPGSAAPPTSAATGAAGATDHEHASAVLAAARQLVGSSGSALPEGVSSDEERGKHEQTWL